MRALKQKAFKRSICFIAEIFFLIPIAVVKGEPVRQFEGFTLLQANIGNAEPKCGKFIYKLCLSAVEEKIRSFIAENTPDIVVLQEVMAPGICNSDEMKQARKTGVWEPLGDANPKDYSCFQDYWDQGLTQVQHLLGDGYRIACNGADMYECVGVLKDGNVWSLPSPEGSIPAGLRIQGCDEDFCVNGLEAPGEFAQGEKECYTGFSITRASLVPNDSPPLAPIEFLTLVNVHPSSTDPKCRNLQIARAFSMAAGGDTIISGDFNMDPRYDMRPKKFFCPPRVPAWDQGFNAGGFRRLSDLEIPTTELCDSLDHVITNISEDTLPGRCVVLGESPDTKFMDGDGKGMDHRGILCRLELK